MDFISIGLIFAGGVIGAKRGFLKLFSTSVALGLGALAARLACGPLSAALAGLGLRPPGHVIIGAFLPFSVVSVYAKFLTGLWLKKRLRRCSSRASRGLIGQSSLGAAFGAASAVFLTGGALRLLCGAETPDGMVASWMHRHPGRVASELYGIASHREALDAEGERWAPRALAKLTNDGKLVRERALRADEEAARARSSGTPEGDGRLVRRESEFEARAPEVGCRERSSREEIFGPDPPFLKTH